MKKKNLILAVLAVVLVLCASIGAASAYFTTYADAKGGYVIQMNYQSVIDESVEGNVKTVRIYNDRTGETGTKPIFVRTRVFSGSDSTLTFDYDSKDWSMTEVVKDQEYLFDYQSALFSGDSPTSELKINVNVADGADVKPGDPIDVIVTCESVPAVFTADGSPDLVTAWNNISAIHEISNG